MTKIFWIDNRIEYQRRNYSTLDKPFINCQTTPGWFYGRDDEDYWSDPYEGHKKEFPHFEISIGDKLLTRNGSIIKVGDEQGSTGFNDGLKERPTEVNFWFFKDTVKDRNYRDYGNHEGTLTYYDKYLNHRSGNHIDKFSGYDIVGLYDDTADKCPCCKRRYDGLSE